MLKGLQIGPNLKDPLYTRPHSEDHSKTGFQDKFLDDSPLHHYFSHHLQGLNLRTLKKAVRVKKEFSFLLQKLFIVLVRFIPNGSCVRWGTLCEFIKVIRMEKTIIHISTCFIDKLLNSSWINWPQIENANNYNSTILTRGKEAQSWKCLETMLNGFKYQVKSPTDT